MDELYNVLNLEWMLWFPNLYDGWAFVDVRIKSFLDLKTLNKSLPFCSDSATIFHSKFSTMKIENTSIILCFQIAVYIKHYTST
jgi:hypothetical protein